MGWLPRSWFGATWFGRWFGPSTAAPPPWSGAIGVDITLTVAGVDVELLERYAPHITAETADTPLSLRS
jgi:hypothetical protein